MTGKIGWVDLTVPNADEVRDFYRDVAGWTVSEVPMGGYADYCMHPGEGSDPVAGVCHAKGVNADIPPGWMIYITVPDVAESVRLCIEKGGQVIRAPKKAGSGAMAIIRDPSGSVAGLYQS